MEAERGEGLSPLLAKPWSDLAQNRAGVPRTGCTISASLGPWVNLDTKSVRFVADAANELSRRDHRAPFVVPDLTAGRSRT